MKIAYDCSSAQPQKNMQYNGGGEYALKILEELLGYMNPVKDFIILLTYGQRGENTQIKKYFDRDNVQEYHYMDINELSEYCSTFDGDLIFFPVCYPQYSVIKIRDDIRVVGAIHDMSSYYYAMFGMQPGRYYKRDGLNVLRYAYNTFLRYINAKKSLMNHKKLFYLNDHTEIYTVSYYSKSNLEYLFPSENIANVFYSPLKNIRKINKDEEISLLSSLNITSGKYILLTSLSRWHKNNMRAILALDYLYLHGMIPIDYKVVLLGCTDDHKKYIKRRIKNTEHFIMLGFVSTDELEIMYKNAYIFVYPSLLEGFGYPPIEAMRYETVSVCSTSTSIPEICGDAVIYFNPLDMDSIRMAFLRAFDSEYYHMVKEKVKNRYIEIRKKQLEDTEKLISFLLETQNENKI